MRCTVRAARRHLALPQDGLEADQRFRSRAIANESVSALRSGELSSGRRPPGGLSISVSRFVDPDALRSLVLNWEEVARDLIGHLQDEVAAAPSDAASRALLDEALSFPGIPSSWAPGSSTIPPPVLADDERAA